MLPNLTSNEVALNNSSRSCWVTIGSNVYDVTEFLDAHPGGGELILEHGGEDVENIMQDEISHAHSKEAYDVLNDNLIGFVAADPVLQTAVESHRPQDILPLPPNETGAEELRANDAADFIPTHTAIETTSMRNTEDLLRDTDAPKDHRKPKFLDLDKPLLMQVWNGNFPKDFYLEEVHHGQSYKGGESAPLFGNFLEPLSKTAWWVIPLVWWPQVAWVSWITYEGIPSGFQFTAYWLTGLFLWTLVEYVMHRGLFHVDK